MLIIAYPQRNLVEKLFPNIVNYTNDASKINFIIYLKVSCYGNASDGVVVGINYRKYRVINCAADSTPPPLPRGTSRYPIFMLSIPSLSYTFMVYTKLIASECRCGCHQPVPRFGSGSNSRLRLRLWHFKNHIKVTTCENAINYPTTSGKEESIRFSAQWPGSRRPSGHMGTHLAVKYQLVGHKSALAGGWGKGNVT